MMRRRRRPAVTPLTEEARAVMRGAFGHALRLGHPYVGGEHMLLALSGTGHLAGVVLREHGVMPERVEVQVVRRAVR
jgi:Clp amino terminal domain, pathogenicity island component